MDGLDRLIRRILAVSLCAAFAVLAMMLLFDTTGEAEEETMECYVVCQPNDYVNARMKPSRRSTSLGRFDTGDRLYTDGIEKNGFLHIVDAGLEMDEAWIYSGYIVFDRPEWMNRAAVVTCKGRLAARKNVDGKIRKWLKTGSKVRVFWWASEWTVTNVGFVKSEYLEMEGE